jgi:RNA polymerase sigma factor (sigma-70 family)
MVDEQLLEQFVSDRDGSAFESLVRGHGPMVLRVCRDVLGDHEHAEDAFQATFLVLVRRAGSIREPNSLGRWLYEVALRIAKRERKRLAKLKAMERQAPEMDAAALPDFDPADRERMPILHEEIGRLPARLREALVLCYLEGLTVEAAASRIGCPVGTLKSRLGKGRELLRSRLTRRGVAASVLLLLLFSLTEETSAEVSEPLIGSTLRAGLAGSEGASVSRRVASMVLEDESATRWARMTVTWSALLLLLILLGTYRLAPGRDATPPTAPASAWVAPTPRKSPPGASARPAFGTLPSGLVPVIEDCHER